MEGLTKGKNGFYYTKFPLLALESDGGKTFLFGGGGGSVSTKEVPNVVQAYWCDEATGKLNFIAEMSTGKKSAVNLSYSAKAGQWLASVGTGCKILALDIEHSTLTEICEWQSESEGREPEQNFAKYSPDASMIVTGGTDGFVKVWTPGKKGVEPSVKATYGGKTKEILDADFSSDSKHLAACDASGVCRIWGVDEDKENDGTVLKYASRLAQGKGNIMIKKVRFVTSADGSKALVVGANAPRGPAVVALFGIDNTMQKEVKVDDGILKSISLDPSGQNLAVGLGTGAKAVYSFPSLRCVQKTKPLHDLPVMMCVFLEGGTAVSASGDYSVHLLAHRAGGGRISSFCWMMLFVVQILVVMLLVLRIGLKGAVLGQGEL